MRPTPLVSLLYFAFCLSIAPASARGQTSAVADPPASEVPGAEGPAAAPRATANTDVTPEVVQSRIDAVQVATDLTESQRAQALDVYKSILAGLNQRSAHQDSIRQLQQSIDGVPAELQKVQQSLESLPSEATLGDTLELTLEQVDARLRDAQQQASSAKTDLANVEATPKRRSERRGELARSISEAQQVIADAGRDAETPAAADLPVVVREAQKTLQDIRRENARLAIEAARLEQELYDKSEELLQRQDEYFRRRSRMLDAEQQLWAELAQQRRQSTIGQQYEEMLEQQRNAPAALRGIAEKNIQLIEKRRAIASSLQDARSELASLTDESRELSDKFGRVQSQLQDGVTGALGELLRRHRQELPRLYVRRARI
ncbi:MAG: hypothetical protein KDA60_04970, partial [Planctomycetales bacterium]|nr:hypothetical protein [Planctomycetales bacterium]